MPIDTKRQNFNITPEQEAELAWLRDTLGAPTTKDAILRAVRVLALLARESQRGNELCVRGGDGSLSRLLIPELALPATSEWQFLAPRPHPWRKQLYVKGRRLSAFDVWSDMRVNGLDIDAAADNWDLPVAAVLEIVRYCEENEALLGMEADEEKRLLIEAGVLLEPATAHRRRHAGEGARELAPQGGARCADGG